jgi:WD40 repeat protein
MSLHRIFVVGILLHGLFVASASSGADTVSYASDIAPLLNKYCVACHSNEDNQGKLRLDSHEELVRGGEHGVIVTPGTPESSRLLLMTSGKLEPKMPPDEAPGPTPEELTLLASWIEQGAIGPSGKLPNILPRVPHIPITEPRPLPLTALAATTDGAMIATAKFGLVEIKTQQGELVRTVPIERFKISSLKFSGDGTRLLVGGGAAGCQGVARIYDIESGEMLTELQGHRDAVEVAVFSPDESLVATGGFDRDILLWNSSTGEAIRDFHGHNGAILDLAFSSDGKVLVSASSDQTIKLWNVSTGERLDTLSQSEGEVFTISITPDSKYIVAGSADNRLRAWRFVSRERPQINPIVATRFIDESGILAIAVSPDGDHVIAASEQGDLKVIRVSDWTQTEVLEGVKDVPSDLCIVKDRTGQNQVWVSLMNGELVTRSLNPTGAIRATTAVPQQPVYLDLGEPQVLKETSLRTADAKVSLAIPRCVKIAGTIANHHEVDRYPFRAEQGEVWSIEADALAGSTLDPRVAVLDDQGEPVLNLRLQALRDSYFTFRGKDSLQSNDFRLFAWQEMNLNDYLYAGGEVSRLWMHPRGPDSGFNVYPGTGNRWTFFNTSHVTHSLGEPAYVVTPLRSGESPIANGLPVFDVFFENDDDPMRLAGKNSRLLFHAPSSGDFTAAIADTRGEGGDNYRYELRIKPAEPRFQPSVQSITKAIYPGTGRECVVKVDRFDGFDGEVVFQVGELPPGVHSTFPVIIEPGQKEAVGNIWADDQCPAWAGDWTAEFTAHAEILGRHFERAAGNTGKLTFAKSPPVVAKILPANGKLEEDLSGWTLSIPNGETIAARVAVKRREGFNNEIGFGKEFAGRNMPHGVYIDNIGLNGLLLLEGQHEREFFITADPMSTRGKRLFFLTAEIDGGLTTPPVELEVLAN